jgi:hypothetical protein
MMGIVENLPAVSEGAAAVAVAVGKIVGTSLLPDELVLAAHGNPCGIPDMLLAWEGTSNVLGRGGQEMSTEVEADSNSADDEGGGPIPGGRILERLNVVLGGTTG